MGGPPPPPPFFSPRTDVTTPHVPDQHTATYRADGSIGIILSHVNPELTKCEPYNWLTTDAHTSGTMCFRWVMPEVKRHLRPTILVNLPAVSTPLTSPHIAAQVSDESLPHPTTKVFKLSALLAAT
jgi:hypothetical protein